MGDPTHYMGSENGSFTGASWQSYSAAPSFTLSNGFGTKTVYFKVKNANGESKVKSDSIEITVAETVSTPTTPRGSTTGSIGTSYSYTTGGSTSSLGHSVQYQFDWKGDGSDLSSWGSATQSKTWTSAGTYYLGQNLSNVALAVSMIAMPVEYSSQMRSGK
jgi:hypothetical protein